MNIEQLLQESSVPVDVHCIDVVRQRVFGPKKRIAPPHYQIHEQIGRGEFGRVYRSTDTRFPREVALKTITYRTHRQLARLEREAHALAHLSHPNVVTVFDKGIADVNNYFVAMELVRGQPLGKWMHERHRKLPEILDVFAQAAEGLHHGHQRGIVHRDFKPSNAIVDTDGRLRIVDFGLAQFAREGDDESSSLPRERATAKSDPEIAVASHTFDDRSVDDTTVEGTPEDLDPMVWTHGDGAAAALAGNQQVVGTPGYASPEQLNGRTTDSRSDQFSLCITLFEAIYGFRPFSGRTIIELTEQIESRTVTRQSPRRTVPAWLDKLLKRGMSPDPDDRYQDLGVIASILRARLEPRSRAKPWLFLAAGMGLTLSVGTTAHLLTKPDEIALRWEGAWPADTTPTDIEAHYGPAVLDRLEDYEASWKTALSEYRERSSRSNDSPQVDCLTAGKNQFRNYVERLRRSNRTGPRSVAWIAGERIWLSHLFDPEKCLSDAPQWERDEELVEQLFDAQAARLTGDYELAGQRLDDLQPRIREQGGVRYALLNYERGRVQLELGDRRTWKSLDDAETDHDGDQGFLLDIRAHRLIAAAFYGFGSEEDFSSLFEDTVERADRLGDDRIGGLIVIADAAHSARVGRIFEAKEKFREARKIFEQLHDNPPYRDRMIAYCDLHEAYMEAWSANPKVDVDRMLAALGTMRTMLGDRHLLYLRHVVETAHALLNLERFGEERRLLETTLSNIEPPFPSDAMAFVILRARTELLFAERSELTQPDAPRRARWLQEATAIARELQEIDDLEQEDRRGHAFRMLSLLFAVFAEGGDLDAAWSTLDQMVQMVMLHRITQQVETICSYTSELVALGRPGDTTGPSHPVALRATALCQLQALIQQDVAHHPK